MSSATKHRCCVCAVFERRDPGGSPHPVRLRATHHQQAQAPLASTNSGQDAMGWGRPHRRRVASTLLPQKQSHATKDRLRYTVEILWHGPALRPAPIDEVLRQSVPSTAALAVSYCHRLSSVIRSLERCRGSTGAHRDACRECLRRNCVAVALPGNRRCALRWRTKRQHARPMIRLDAYERYLYCGKTRTADIVGQLPPARITAFANYVGAE